jgi:hypothetical protein
MVRSFNLAYGVVEVFVEYQQKIKQVIKTKGKSKRIWNYPYGALEEAIASAGKTKGGWKMFKNSFNSNHRQK